MTSPEPGPEKQTRAFVGLGSNIDASRNLPRAIARLVDRLDVTEVSSLWASDAQGSPGSPPFLNAVAALMTSLGPVELKFDVLRSIESEMGRVRCEDRNAPRVIDLDLLLYGDLTLDRPGLRLPDPELETSAHVVVPLAEIAPTLRHPACGETMADLAASFSAAEIRVVAPPPSL